MPEGEAGLRRYIMAYDRSGKEPRWVDTDQPSFETAAEAETAMAELRAKTGGIYRVATEPAKAQSAAIPAEMKAGPGEERVVASVYNEAGELQRRMTVKPDVALKIPVGPGEHVTATAKTADGENVDQQRGQRGSRLKLAITDREIQGLQRGGKLMDSIGDRLAAFKEQQAQFIAERRGGIERKRKVRLD